MAGPGKVTRSDRRRLSGLSVPLVEDQELRRFLEAVSEHVRMYEGDRNAPKERFVTIDDLERAGVIGTKVRNNFAEVSAASSTAAAATTSNSASSAAGSFASLTDTEVPTVSPNNFLKFNGTKWVNFNFDTTPRSIKATWTFEEAISFEDDVELVGGVSLFIRDLTGSDSVEAYHDGSDFNFDFTNTADWNITGLTSIQAGTVDADFDDITATSYGGIVEANLLDRVATEGVTGDWTFTGATVVPEATVTAHEAALTILESQITDAGILARVAGDEAITGAWTFSQSLQASGSLFLEDQAAAGTDQTGFGQIWVRSSDGALMFTDDVGTDFVVDLTAV